MNLGRKIGHYKDIQKTKNPSYCRYNVSDLSTNNDRFESEFIVATQNISFILFSNH